MAKTFSLCLGYEELTRRGFFNLCCCLCSDAAESIVAGSAEAVAAAMISQDTKHMKICSVQITDEELHNFIEILRKEEDIDNGDDEPQWENTVEKKSHIVAYSAKRRDPKVSKIPSRKSPTPVFFSSLSPSSAKLQTTERILIRSVCSWSRYQP